jgi:hypothetical protein
MTWNRTDAVLAEQGGHGLYNPGLSLSLFSVDFSLHSTILNMSPSSESAQSAPTSSAPNVQSGYEPRGSGTQVRTNSDPGDSVSRKRSSGPVMINKAEPLSAGVEQTQASSRYDRRGALVLGCIQGPAQGLLQGEEDCHQLHDPYGHDGQGRTDQEPRLRATGVPEEGVESRVRAAPGQQGVRATHEGEGRGSGHGFPSVGAHGLGHVGNATGGVGGQDGQGEVGYAHGHYQLGWSVQGAGNGNGNGPSYGNKNVLLHYDIGTPHDPDFATSIKAFIARKDDVEYAKIKKLQGPANWTEWKEDIRFILLEKGLEEYVLEDPPQVPPMPKSIMPTSARTRAETAKATQLSDEDKEERVQYEIAHELYIVQIFISMKPKWVEEVV